MKKFLDLTCFDDVSDENSLTNQDRVLLAEVDGASDFLLNDRRDGQKQDETRFDGDARVEIRVQRVCALKGDKE